MNAAGMLRSRRRPAEFAVELGEAHIIAHGEPETACGRVDHTAPCPARVARLAIALARAREVDVEQMDLVVARRALSLRVEHERRRPAATPASAYRLRAGDDPEPELARDFREVFLDRAGPVAIATLVAPPRFPMKEKFSGSVARPAPCSRASPSSRHAVSRFFATSASEVI